MSAFDDSILNKFDDFIEIMRNHQNNMCTYIETTKKRFEDDKDKYIVDCGDIESYGCEKISVEECNELIKKLQDKLKLDNNKDQYEKIEHKHYVKLACLRERYEALTRIVNKLSNLKNDFKSITISFKE